MKEYMVQQASVSYMNHNIITYIDDKINSMFVIRNNDSSIDEIKEQSIKLESKGFKLKK
ncbi:MAG: hypothetical protein R3Y60_01780 [bacterium]